MEYPTMREELLGYLQALSNWEYQNDCWVNGNCPPDVEHDELDYAIHFIFDDTSLFDDPDSLIGVFLKDKEEVKLIRRLCFQLNLIFEKYGTGLSDEEYINKPEWKKVMGLASAAFIQLSQPELVNGGLLRIKKW